MATIASHPDRYPVVEDDTRRLLVGRFPYGIFYIAAPDEILITAIYRHKRDPKGRQMRI